MHITYYVAASVDGLIGPPDGGLDWLAPFEGGAEDYGYRKFFESVDAVLLGRKTYEQSLGFGKWPYEGKRCRVFSRQKLEALPPLVAATTHRPREVVRKGIQLFGGNGAHERLTLVESQRYASGIVQLRCVRDG